jgi:hypothetical protein
MEPTIEVTVALGSHVPIAYDSQTKRYCLAYASEVDILLIVVNPYGRNRNIKSLRLPSRSISGVPKRGMRWDHQIWTK